MLSEDVDLNDSDKSWSGSHCTRMACLLACTGLHNKLLNACTLVGA